MPTPRIFVRYGRLLMSNDQLHVLYQTIVSDLDLFSRSYAAAVFVLLERERQSRPNTVGPEITSWHKHGTVLHGISLPFSSRGSLY